jgi:hypothetical protein
MPRGVARRPSGRGSRLGLQGVIDVLERVAHTCGRRARDHERASPADFTTCVDDIRDHRPSGQGVEELRRSRFHPRAEAGGHDDRSDPRRGAGTWGVHEGRRGRAAVGGEAAIPTRSGPGACRLNLIELVAASYERPFRVSNLGTATVQARRSATASASGRRAIISISTRAPLGSPAMPTVERAGGGSGMCFA